MKRSIASRRPSWSCQAAPAQAVDLDDPAAQWLPRTRRRDLDVPVVQQRLRAGPRTERYALTARAGDRLPGRAGRSSSCGPTRSRPRGFAGLPHTPTPAWSTSTSSPRPRRRSSRSCARPRSRCGNTLAGTHVPTMLGGRARPCWPSRSCRARPGTPSAARTTTSTAANRYIGRESTSPSRRSRRRSTAAKIESVITQAGALGDPFGTRPAHGVVGLRRRPGEDRSSSTPAARASFAQLQSTNLAAAAAPERREPAAAEAGHGVVATAGATTST